MDILDPLMTWYREHPDYDAQDARNEAQLLYERQGAIEDLLEGKVKADDVLDRLDQQGINAAAYADTVCAQIEVIIDNGIAYTSNEAGLLLPSGVLL
ncbi:hypothetical protein [Adonisia turfae]|nr:hypothetical protein [Adonisia turfae]